MYNIHTNINIHTYTHVHILTHTQISISLRLVTNYIGPKYLYNLLGVPWN